MPRLAFSRVSDMVTPSQADRLVRVTSLFRYGILLLSLLPVVPAINARAGDDNGYPTEARAEYIFACMATNGQTQEALRRCSCAMNVIASVLPYDKFENAETVLRMRRSAGGYLGPDIPLSDVERNGTRSRGGSGGG